MTFKIKDGLSIGANTIFDATGSNLTLIMPALSKTTLSNTTAAGASLNLGTGTADPSSPVTGDFWNNTGVLKIRQSGGTKTIAFTDSTITGNAANVTGTVAIANGGTNVTSVGAAGTVVYATGSAYGFTAAGTSGQFLTSTGAGAPVWATLSQNISTVGNPQFNSIGIGIAADGVTGTITGTQFTGNSATVTNGVYTNTTQTISGAKTFTAATGIIIQSTAPVINFFETDPTLPAGRVRLVYDASTFQLQRNTALAGDFSSSSVDLYVSSTGALTTIGSISAGGVITGTSFNLITGLSATIPSAPGTATQGSATTAARADHVHQIQTSVSGNAGSATVLATARNINGVAFDGSAAITVADGTKMPLAGGTFTGQFNIQYGAPTICFQDTDNMTASLHCNSNVFYVLRNPTPNTTSWDNGPNNRHPMTLSLSSGDVAFSGNVTAYSDARLKKNIVPITNSLDKISALTGVMFERLEGQKGTGLIAQNVQAIIPEAVTEDIDGYLSVSYGNLVGLLVEAIKELKQEIETLKSK